MTSPSETLTKATPTAGVIPRASASAHTIFCCSLNPSIEAVVPVRGLRPEAVLGLVVRETVLYEVLGLALANDGVYGRASSLLSVICWCPCNESDTALLGTCDSKLPWKYADDAGVAERPLLPYRDDDMVNERASGEEKTPERDTAPVWLPLGS